MNKQTVTRRKRTARETRTAYADKTTAAKPVTRKPRAKKLVVEMYGGEPYEYYPLGKYVVAAPGVCGGRPTFKYTRIEAAFILDLMRSGWTLAELEQEYAESNLTIAAIQEAMLLARDSFVMTSTALALAV